jgi:hypothetical protein
MVLLLPTLGAGYCALMLDSCQGKMAEVGVGAPDCCLSCFDAAMKESIIKTPLTIYAPHHHGVQAWLPTTVNLAVTFQASTFGSEMALDTGPPPNPLLLSALRI